MTASQKSISRIKVVWFGMFILFAMVVCGFLLVLNDKDVAGFATLSASVALAVGGIIGSNYFSTPKDSHV